MRTTKGNPFRFPNALRMHQKFTFKNNDGNELAGRLELPDHRTLLGVKEIHTRLKSSNEE